MRMRQAIRLAGFVCGVAGLLAVGGGTVFAEEEEAGAKRRAERAFGNLDADGDGKVVADEVTEERQKLFARLVKNGDKDGNGELSKEEFLAAFGERRERKDSKKGDAESRRRRGDGPEGDDGPRRRRPDGPQGDDARRPRRPDGPPRGPDGRPMFGPGPLMRALDSDHDGKLSTGEIDAASEALKELDRDGDGEITMRELGPPAGGPDGPRRRFGRPGGDDGPDGPRGRRFGRREGDAGPERGEVRRRIGMMVDRILEGDEDGDGMLSEDETPERMRRGFGRLDTNEDGKLDREELARAIGRVMQERNRGEGDRPREGDRRRRGRRGDAPRDGDDAPAEGDAS